MAKTIIKATKSPLFLIIAGLVIVAGTVFLFLPSDSEAGAGAIWTTNNACGASNQDLNHYIVDDWVYINGENFAANTSYNWDITGKPGGASADPGEVVKSGSQTTDSNGAFCFQAYQISHDGDPDNGEYTVTFDGNKKDNYQVDDVGLLTIRKEGYKRCAQVNDFDMYIKDPSLSTNPDNQIIRRCNNNAYCLDIGEEVTTILDPGIYRAGEIHYESLFDWTLDCDANFTPYNTNNGHEAEVNLQAGQHITCTYTNDEKVGIKRLWAEARDSATNNLVKGACFQLSQVSGPGCPGGTWSPSCDGQYDLLDGKVSLGISSDPGCDYRIRMTTIPSGYTVPINPILLTQPLTSDSCNYSAQFMIDPQYATINVHKNVLGSDGIDDIVDYTNFTARVNGEDKIFYEGSPANYTVLAKTTDVKEVNAETNPDFVFMGCSIDTDHTIEIITNGIKILNIEEDDVINVTCTNRHRTFCGDGVPEDPNERGESEECDDGTNNGNNTCSVIYDGSDCIYCSSSCQEITVPAPFCGDRNQDPVEECDDGNNTDNDGCSASCLDEFCGDGLEQTSEECDDGNNTDNDGCSASCLDEYCGDSTQNGTEECDDGNASNNDSCLNSCMLAECGDSYKQTSTEECDDGNLDNNDGCSATCTEEFSYIQGKKFNDLDNDGATHETGEPFMNNWGIRLYDDTWSQIGIDHITGETGVLGQYKFENLTLGEYFVCEVLQSGWIQTHPSGKANLSGEADEAPYCFYVNIRKYNKGYTSKQFGNYYAQCGNDILDTGELCESGETQECTTDDGYVGFQSCSMPISDGGPDLNPNSCDWDPCVSQKTCGDGILNGNEQCDGTDGVIDNYTCTDQCLLEYVPYCGDGIVDEGEECDGTAGITGNQTCSDNCISIEPEPEPELEPLAISAVLSILKTVNKTASGPGDTLTYAVTVSNSSEGGATNVILTDVLPAGLTFANEDGTNSGDTEKTWTWDELAAGEDVTITYSVLVDSNAAEDIYDNVATVEADDLDQVSAKASTEVRIPVVLGETSPSLTITKTVDKDYANPGGTATYSVIVTNDGDAPALNAVLNDVLPAGFVFADTGNTTAAWNLGDIVPTESVTKTYDVKIDASILAGKYTNTATVSADDVDGVSAKADLEVKEIVVLGAEEEIVLPTTGGGLAIIALSGLMMIGTGIFIRRKIK